MKRDPDLIRDLLNYIEKTHDGVNYLTSKGIKIKDSNQEEISYHISLLHDTGLILGKNTSNFRLTPFWIIARLTNDGHDFLEAARNEKAWNRIKDKMAEAGGFVLDVAKILLIKYMEEMINPGST